MSSKFENTLAQLHKLKNQMRIELNQIRPYKDYSVRQQNQVKKSQKKCFAHNYQQPSNVCPLVLKENQNKPERRKKIQSQNIPHLQFTRSFEKKHFDKHYNDSVNTQMCIKKTKSSYLNIKTERKQNNQQTGYGNSIVGIGSGNQNIHKSRSSIRVYAPQYISGMGQMGVRRNSLFS